jgi:hypothetical protein
MCAHEVDELGYPVDPELRELEMNLCDLICCEKYFPVNDLAKEGLSS